ncbi:MAG: cytochrome P450 [Trichodesmium sp. St5_bin2_1]|nr:cytochrome P450 [Trichodesmium sp. St5_bin2_1]
MKESKTCWNKLNKIFVNMNFQSSNLSSSLALPPGNLGLPWIGQKQKVFKNPQNFMEEVYQKYGPVSKTRFLGKNFIYFQGYEAIKFVLTNENKYFTYSQIWRNYQKIFGRHYHFSRQRT